MSEIFRWPADDEPATDRPEGGEAGAEAAEDAFGWGSAERKAEPSDAPEDAADPEEGSSGPEPSPDEPLAPGHEDDMFRRFWGSEQEGRRGRRERGRSGTAAEPAETAEPPEIVPTPALRPTQSRPPTLGPQASESPEPVRATEAAVADAPREPAERPAPEGPPGPPPPVPEPPARSTEAAASAEPGAATRPETPPPARDEPPPTRETAPPAPVRPPPPSPAPPPRVPATAPSTPAGRRRAPPELARLRAAMDDLSARLERSPGQTALTDAIGEMRAEVDQLGLAVNTLIARLDTRPDRGDGLSQVREALETATERITEGVAVGDRNGRAAFAVVSREVKALADQNRALTEEVRGLAEALAEVPRALGGFRAESTRARSETLAAVESLDGHSKTAFTLIGREVRALIDRHRMLVTELRNVLEEVRSVADELSSLREQVRQMDEARFRPETALELE